MSYITGPAALKIGSGPYLYSEAGFTVKLATKTGQVTSDLHGELGKFVVSRKATITGKAVGAISSGLLGSLFPNGVANIGASVLTTGDQAVEIWTKAGQLITWQRGGVTKTPELTLSATKSLFSGELEVTCLGAAYTSPANDPTNAAHWNTISEATFTEATFDPSQIKRYRYTAAYGASPYNAMTAQEGFKVAITQETEEISDDNVGVADIILKSIAATCTFTPSNLTEAQIWALVQLQDTSALQPGDLVCGNGTTDLVITGSGLTLTLSKPGFFDAAALYATGKLRAGELQATCSRTFTSGSPDPLFTFALS